MTPRTSAATAALALTFVFAGTHTALALRTPFKKKPKVQTPGKRTTKSSSAGGQKATKVTTSRRPKPIPGLKEAQEWLAEERGDLVSVDEALHAIAQPRSEEVNVPEPPPFPEAERRNHNTYRILVKLVDADDEVITEGFDRDQGIELRATEEVGAYQVHTTRDGWEIDSRESAAKKVIFDLKDRNWEFVKQSGRAPQVAVDWSAATSELLGQPYRVSVPPEARRAPILDVKAFQPVPLPPPPRVSRTVGKYVFPQLTPLLHSVVYRLTVARQSHNDALADRDLLDERTASIRPSGCMETQKALARCYSHALASLDAATLELRALEQNLADVTGRGASPALASRELANRFGPHRNQVERLLPSARALLHQLRAEALWWQAELANPNAPNRRLALDALAAAPDTPAVRQQEQRYRDVADREELVRRELERAIQAGKFDTPPVLVQDVRYTTQLRIAVRSTAQ